MADKAGKEGFGSQFFSGLFWKTFGALFILVLTSVCAWLYGLAVLNEAPRAQAASLRITAITTLTRYALISADTSYRFDLIMALAQREGLTILPKEPYDRIVPLESDSLNDLILDNVRFVFGQEDHSCSEPERHSRFMGQFRDRWGRILDPSRTNGRKPSIGCQLDVLVRRDAAHLRPVYGTFNQPFD